MEAVKVNRNIAEGFADVNSQLIDVQSSIGDGNRKLDNLQQSISAGVSNINDFTSTKIDDAVTCLQQSIVFDTIVNQWNAQFSSIKNFGLNEATYYGSLLFLAEQILRQTENIPGKEKISAMYIYLQTIIETGNTNKHLLKNKDRISNGILPKIGELFLSIIQQKATDRSIARESLLDLSTMANHMYRLLYDTPVVFVEKGSLEDTIRWNVSLQLSRNEGVDLLVHLFQLLNRTSSLSRDEQSLKYNIEQLGYFLNCRDEQEPDEQPMIIGTDSDR